MSGAGHRRGCVHGTPFRALVRESAWPGTWHTQSVAANRARHREQDHAYALHAAIKRRAWRSWRHTTAPSFSVDFAWGLNAQTYRTTGAGTGDGQSRGWQEREGCGGDNEVRQDAEGANTRGQGASHHHGGANTEYDHHNDRLVVRILEGAVPTAGRFEHLHADAENQERGGEHL